jgi:lipoate-protein ligase A
MAVDEVLLNRIKAIGRPVLRFYAWTEPAATIGYFQSPAAAPDERVIVRRITGGGAVDHCGELTYSVVTPPDHWLVSTQRLESYRLIHLAVAAGLSRLGITAAMAPEELDASVDRVMMKCFVSPTRYDLITPNGTKVAGAAQRRTNRGMLHQGSVAGLAESDRSEWQAALCDGFSESLRVHADATPLALEKYAAATWLNRR